MKIEFDGEYAINFLTVCCCLLAFLALVHLVQGCDLEKTRIATKAKSSQGTGDPK